MFCSKYARKCSKKEQNSMILEHTSIICIIYLEKPGRLCYYIPCRRDVAQFGRALRSGRKGRRFESCHPDHRQIKQGKNPALFVLYSLIIGDSNLGEAQPIQSKNYDIINMSKEASSHEVPQ